MGFYDTVYEDWIRKAEKVAEERGRAEGEEFGIAEGEVNAARRHCISILTKRLGALPEELTRQIDSAEPAWCEKETWSTPRLAASTG